MTMTNDPISLTRPNRPAEAYDKHVEQVLSRAKTRPVWAPSDGPLPSLFVSHGAPFTLDDPQWIAELFQWSQSIPKPRAVVVVSAHGEQAPVAISGTAAGTPFHYDFNGFHPRYKTLPCATPGATTLAQRLVKALPAGRRCTSSPTVASTTAPSFPVRRGSDTTKTMRRTP